MKVKQCPPIAMSFVILCLALVVGTAMAEHAPSGPAHVLKTLHDEDLTSFRSLVKSPGAYNALAAPAVKFTMLAPTNSNEGVAHGIASALQPATTGSSAASKAAAAPPQATAAVTTPSTFKAQQTTAVSSKSSMVDFIAKIFAHKAAVVNSMSGSKPRAAVVAIDAPANPAKATGAYARKLLQAAAPAWADTDVQGTQQHLDHDATTMGEQEHANATNAAAEKATQARPSTPAFAHPKIDTGKSISEATSGTRNQEAAEDQISGIADASDADPTLPAWAQPSLSTGKSIGDSSANRNEADAEDAINNAVAAFDTSTCC